MYKLSALALHKAFLRGELSAVAIAEYFLKRIAFFDDQTGAFLATFDQSILEQAYALDQKRSAGNPIGKMAAVPIALKDNIHVEGELTTCASKMLANYRAVFNATVSAHLKAADALIIGKTNLDEFAMGSSTETSYFKKTRNPWNLATTAGGSSGGSAAAVAGRLVPLSLGSDTGGSIRQPAAFTGIFGFKPTYGRISRYGLVAFASSLDQIGPFSTQVEDSAYLMETIALPCSKDATNLREEPACYTQVIKEPVTGMKVGVPVGFIKDLNPVLAKNFQESVAILQNLGVEIIEVDLSLLKYSVAVYYTIATAEASTNLARYDGVRYGHRSPNAKTLDEVYELSKQEGFGPEVKSRILLGTYLLSSSHADSHHKKARQVRTLIIEQLAKAFCFCDVIAMPCTAQTAFETGSIADPIELYLQDLYTIAANLAGIPAASVPSGFTKEGMPMGLQLLGPQKQDANVLKIAYHFEQVQKHYKNTPPLFDKTHEEVV